MLKRGLGKGLHALIPETSVFTGGRTIVSIDVGKVIPNPRQPRTEFDPESLAELSESIKASGIAQPVLVRIRNGKYELVAGERRWRAARKAGLSVIPAIVKDFSDEESLEIALIENLQREDLNPMDEAEAYLKLAEEFKMTQADIAKRVGKDRSTVANMMRLTELPREIQHSIRKQQVSVGHARTILALQNQADQLSLWQEILRNNLTVRDVEQLVAGKGKRASGSGAAASGRKRKFTKNDELNDVTELLMSHLGTKVRVYGSRKRGKIEIDYFSQEDLERLIEQITGSAAI
jgi:ParB family chromosome partitioning protein